MTCTTCATLNIMCMYYLRLLPSFSHLICFRGTSPAFQRKIRVRRPHRARKNRSCCPWKTPSSPETSHSRYTTLLDNPFRSDPSRGQVDFCFLGLLVTSFGFSRLWTWLHPNISPDSSPDTRPSNSCSELAAIWASRLAVLQPANTTASQQIRHIRVHVLISLECLHTTPIFF